MASEEEEDGEQVVPPVSLIENGGLVNLFATLELDAIQVANLRRRDDLVERLTEALKHIANDSAPDLFSVPMEAGNMVMIKLQPPMEVPLELQNLSHKRVQAAYDYALSCRAILADRRALPDENFSSPGDARFFLVLRGRDVGVYIRKFTTRNGIGYNAATNLCQGKPLVLHFAARGEVTAALAALGWETAFSRWHY